MAIKKVVTDQNIGKGLIVEGGKLNVNVDTATMEIDTVTSKLKAKQITANDLKGDEVQDLDGASMGFFVKS